MINNSNDPDLNLTEFKSDKIPGFPTTTEK